MWEALRCVWLHGTIQVGGIAVQQTAHSSPQPCNTHQTSSSLRGSDTVPSDVARVRTDKVSVARVLTFIC
jgi:hypothetical protein